MSWYYKRGWHETKEYPLVQREREAEEKIRLWGYQQRWKKFPQLGSIPAKWMKWGPPPASRLTYVSEILTAVYSPSIRGMLNEPSPLLKLLQ